MRTLEQIDEAIDANRRALMARVHANPDCSARAWGNAWDRCPDLRQRERELFVERDEAQRSVKPLPIRVGDKFKGRNGVLEVIETRPGGKVDLFNRERTTFHTYATRAVREMERA